MSQSLLQIQLLDITSLSSPEPRSSFSKHDIDELANNFLQIGGNTNLILVKRLDLENFQVIEGHLEYYAAVRAREIDDNFERISGIILDKSNTDLIKQQYFKGRNLNVDTEINPSGVEENFSGSKTAIANLEKNLLSHLQDQLRFEVSRLETNLSKNLEQKFDGVKILIPRDEDHLKAFNNAELKELIDKLGSAGFTGKRGEKIASAIVQERNTHCFTSFSEITQRVHLNDKKKTRAITEVSMLKILDTWNRFIDTHQV